MVVGGIKLDGTRLVSERFPASQRSPNKRRTVLYFYHSKSRQRTEFITTGQPCYNAFEYRFLEVLSRKYRVIVAIFVRPESAELTEKIVPDGVRVVLLRDLPLLKYLPLPAALFAETLTRVMRVAILVHTIRPSIVIGNWITRFSGLYCALVGFHPFLAVAWGSDILVEARRSMILRMLARLTIRAADGVVVDSEIQRRAVLSLGCRSMSIYCFPWGIDLDLFRPEKTREIREKLGWLDDKIVVSTRNHSPIYGVEYSIRAMALALARVKDAKLLVIGNGPLLEYHKSLARRLGIDEKVAFLGYVPNHLLPAILNAADVYVSTSFSDGSSASLMEAMACGLPVVVTRIPANEEWVVHGQNGFLVPPGDSIALADSVVRILQDERVRSLMRKANLEAAKKRADWKVNSLMLEKAVFELLASAPYRRDRVARKSGIGIV